MSDQQVPGQSREAPSDVPDGAPTKRTCTIDTPPIAATPADSGSDFYDTPWPVGTPSNIQTNENTSQSQTSEPVAPQPASLIPGLSLVNDSWKDLQPTRDEVVPEDQTQKNEQQNVSFTAETQNNMTADNELETAKQKTNEPAPATGDAMEVDEASGQQNSTDKVTTTNTEQVSNTNTNGTEAAPASAPEAALDEQEDEHPEWEIDSSPYESSSDDDSSTDSSDDSDDEDDEDYPILSPEEQARILMQAEMGSDDEGEGGKGKSGGQVKTANELPEEVPPIPEVTVTPDMKIVLLGHVQAIVENTVVIMGNISGEYQVLESGSLLCLEDRRVVGVVSETLGRVEQPIYAVRYQTAAELEERGVAKDKSIYYVESHSTFVFTQPLKGLKGSDASNFHDEEIGEDEIEFSDDEAEAEYRRKLKQKRQERKDARGGDAVGSARGKKGPPPGPSKLSHTELNYDDDGGEDGYTPLARPKNLHEMMGRQEATMEGTEHSSRGGGFRGGRGRGRGGYDRGRGNRGRGGAGGSRDQHERRSFDQSQSSSSHYQPSTTDAQPQPSHYGQPMYGMPQQFPFQLPQQQTFAPQGAIPMQFPFQMPYQQAYQQLQQPQQNPYLNPAFLAAIQQHQQQQQQQQQQQYQASQQVPGAPQVQNTALNFDQVKAQLDLLRQLSNNGNQGPRPT